MSKVNNWKEVKTQDFDEVSKLFEGKKAISFGAFLCQKISTEMQISIASAFKIVDCLQRAGLIVIGGRSSVLGCIKEDNYSGSSSAIDAKLMINFEWHDKTISIRGLYYYNVKAEKYDVFQLAKQADALVVSYCRDQRIESSWEASLYHYLMHDLHISIHSIASVVDSAQGKCLLSNYSLRQRATLLGKVLNNNKEINVKPCVRYTNGLLFEESKDTRSVFWLIVFEGSSLKNIGQFTHENYIKSIPIQKKIDFISLVKRHPKIECFVPVSTKEFDINNYKSVRDRIYEIKNKRTKNNTNEFI